MQRDRTQTVALKKTPRSPDSEHQLSEVTEEQTRPDDGHNPLRIYKCRACGHQICLKDYAVRINGSHAHTFANPHGIVFEIGCFHNAPGCVSSGPAYDDFSWFSGYRWRICDCRGCAVHLGWMFLGAAPPFFGLVLDRLVEVTLE